MLAHRRTGMAVWGRWPEGYADITVKDANLEKPEKRSWGFFRLIPSPQRPTFQDRCQQ